MKDNLYIKGNKMLAEVTFPVSRKELIRKYGKPTVERVIAHIRQTRTIWMVHGTYEEAKNGTV
jgi:hypothetical protein